MTVNDDSQRDSEVRALRLLIDEMREEAVPALDWDDAERRLLDRISPHASAERSREALVQATPVPVELRGGAGATLQGGAVYLLHRRTLARVGVVLTLAAAVALIVVTQVTEMGRRLAAVEPEPAAVGSEVVDHRRLPVVEDRVSGQGEAFLVESVDADARIQSGDEPLRFTLPGVASWTLAPRSSVVVKSLGVPHLLVLEEGQVTAQVVPKASSETQESFAVEAGACRVAVRGTVFSVDRSHGHVAVQVLRGRVMVGPAGATGATDGHLLVGPSRATFSLGGERVAHASDETAALVEGPSPSGEPGVSPGAGHSSWGGDRRPSRAESSSAPTPSAAPAAPAEHSLSVGEAQGMLVACLGGGDPGDGEEGSSVRVTISSQVHVRLDDDQRVTSVQFVPPLKPSLQSCASQLTGRKLDVTGRQAQFGVIFTPR